MSITLFLKLEPTLPGIMRTSKVTMAAEQLNEDQTLREPLSLNISTVTEERSTIQTAMAGPKLSQSTHKTIVGALLGYTAIAGFVVNRAQLGFFSWHPFLMVAGFIGMMGSSAVTKKLGGYTNTKLHGMMASGGLMMAFGGLYVIYRNKEILGKEHITTTHALAGIITMAGALMAAIAGGVFLHPDFGVDKTNKTVRFAHKWFARSVTAAAWINCVVGLMKMTSDKVVLAAFIVPLVVLAPMTLI